MPAPSSSLSTLRPDLGGSLEEFSLQAQIEGFVGLQIMPAFEAQLQAGHFGRITLAELLQSKDTARAAGAAYGRGEWKFTDDSYATKENGWEEPVDDRESNMYRNYFDAELVSATRARSIVLEQLERRIVAAALAATNTAAGTAALTDTSASKPIDDVRAAWLALYGRVGLVAKFAKLVVSLNRFQYLKDNAQIVDRVKSSGFVNVQRGEINEQMIAQALGISGLIVAGSMKNTANQGQTASLASIWTDTKGFLFVPAMSNDIRAVCFGRTIHWGEDGSTIGTTIESYRDESRRSNIIRARMDTHEKTMYDAAGQVITGW